MNIFIFLWSLFIVWYLLLCVKYFSHSGSCLEWFVVSLFFGVVGYISLTVTLMDWCGFDVTRFFNTRIVSVAGYVFKDYFGSSDECVEQDVDDELVVMNEILRGVKRTEETILYEVRDMKIRMIEDQ